MLLEAIMAIVEFQFRKQVFLDYFKAEINRRRLPFPTLDSPFLPQVKGHLLERIECRSCTAAATSGGGQLTVQAEIAIHYHTSLATIRAAGSLKRAVTEQQIIPVPVVFSVRLDTPNPQLQWVPTFGLIPPDNVPLNLPAGLNPQSAAVEASEDVIVIRLGTRPDDPVNAPITSRLGNSDWSQLIPGQLFVDQFTAGLSRALASAISGDLESSKSSSGVWLPDGMPLGGGNVPLVIVSAEITAMNISVLISLTAQFAVSGHTLVTTLTLNCVVESILFDVLGTLILPPIGGFVFHEIAEDTVSEILLGEVGTPTGFQKIGETDNSITYQSTSLLSGPSSSFVLTHAEVNKEGLLMTGDAQIRPLPLGLQGSVSTPVSSLDRDCNRKRVTVEFRPAQVFLNDIGMDGPPKIFPDGILFNPAGAWAAVPGASNDWLDLALTFVDPPGGRLPVGTATSVILDTDCGVRWVDLGVIPPDHEQPTVGDIAEMLSRCMGISDPWGDGVMNLDWLVDWPDLRYEFEPVRQWTIGVRDLQEDVRFEFVAVGPDGEERVVGATGGRQNFAVQITTNANETLQIRTMGGLSAPAPVVFQRWIVPFASLPLESVPAAVSAFERMVGVIGFDGNTQVVQIAAGGVLSTQRLNGERQMDPSLDRLVNKLAREVRRNREPWAVAAQIDRQTVAVSHGQELLIGTMGPVTKM